MSKFTEAIKLQVVKEYASGKFSYRELAKYYEVDESVIRYWELLYRHHGENAFNFTYTNYPAAFKLEVIKFINEKNYSIREASAIFHIPDPSMVRRWRKKWEEAGEDALESRKGPSIMGSNQKKSSSKEVENQSKEALENELEYLRMENAYLKKLRGLSSGKELTNKLKAQVVFELRHEFPVAKLVKVAGIKRNTYYYQVKRMQEPDPDRKWKRRINFIFHKHKGRLGYRRITDVLQEKGHIINAKKVLRIMQELGIKCVVRMKKYKSYKGAYGKAAPNVLDRKFRAEIPNQKWVTDVTEFRLFGEKFYFSPVLDLFNGEILTFTLQSRPTFDLVEKMLNQALEHKKENDNLLIHSDQGWHYRMPQYREILEQNKITQSMSRKGNCFDNAVIENFFGILKYEFLFLEEFESIEHFKKELEAYIYYYNHLRIKSRLNRKSPVAYRKAFELTV
ncbi:IS3 family transposase [Virgibacillus halodenitrificans]|uniref:IS3 family transposase n=1 Tax=Virgibacillus halodenitrificans TaxID=1482 RepID=UPI000C1FB92F|nr:IS3 family transposase [Virgibacillus halodenitrificans]